MAEKARKKPRREIFRAAVLYVGLVLTKDIIRVNVQYFTGLRDRVYRDDLFYESNRPTTTVTGRETGANSLPFVRKNDFATIV